MMFDNQCIDVSWNHPGEWREMLSCSQYTIPSEIPTSSDGIVYIAFHSMDYHSIDMGENPFLVFHDLPKMYLWVQEE
jgi:hypothetical protein